jgi:ABC transporter substrate binding protein
MVRSKAKPRRAANGAEPIGPGPAIDQGDRGAGLAGVGAVESGPAQLGFRADHPRAGLIVDADLGAAEETGDVVLVDAPEGRSGEGIFLQAQCGTGMHADVDAGPAEDRGRGFVGAQDGQVRGARRAHEGQSRKHDNAAGLLDHGGAPTSVPCHPAVELFHRALVALRSLWKTLNNLARAPAQGRPRCATIAMLFDDLVDAASSIGGAVRPRPRSLALADRILKGARSADLPFEQPTNFRLVINKRTLESLGLRIPAAMLMRADDVVD